MQTSLTAYSYRSGVCNSMPCLKAVSAITSAMDPSGDPCDDFYQFACGRWSQTNPIPDWLESWAVSHKFVLDNLLDVRNILGM